MSDSVNVKPDTGGKDEAPIKSSEPTKGEYDNYGVVASDTAAQVEDENSENYMGEPKEITKSFTYPAHTDPQRAKDPHGVYLDDVERRQAEIKRAAVEGRDPDLKNPPAIQSTPLLPTDQVKKYVPGDHPVPTDEELPVIVGVSEANADFYGDAIKQRDVKDK